MTTRITTSQLLTTCLVLGGGVSFATADGSGYFPWPPVGCHGCGLVEWLPGELDEATPRNWIALDEYGAANPGAEPTVTFLSEPSNDTRSFYQVQLHGFWAGYSQHHQAGEHPSSWSLSIPGNPKLDQPGLPALPTILFSAGLPSIGELELESVQYGGIESWSIVSDQGGVYTEVMAAQPDVEEVPGAFDLPDYEIDRGFYQEMNVAWPLEDGSATAFSRGNINLGRIELNPIRYNPADGSLHVSRTIACSVRHFGEAVPPMAINRASLASLDAEIPNLQDLVARGIVQPQAAPTRNYLFVLPEEFFEEVQPLASLKLQRGYQVQYRFTSEGMNSNDISNTVRDWYTDLENPGDAYVLLVGDSSRIAHATTTSVNSNGNYKTSDTLYTCLFNTWEPLCSIGRLPAGSEAECQAMVNKSVAYQDDPGLDPDFYSTATIAAHRGEQAYLDCAEEIITNSGYAHSRTFIDRSGDTAEGNTTGVMNDVEHENVGLVLYRGHGSAKRWSNWDYDGDALRAVDVDTFQNTDYNPVVISAACSNSNMGSQPDCLAVRWMETEFGASAHIGAMAGSRRGANNVFAVDIMNRIQGSGRVAIGDAMLNALSETMIQKNFNNASTWNFEVYQLLGDPSMRVWNSAPTALVMSAPDGITLDEAFAVQVTDAKGLPVVGAVVAASDHGDVHATAWTNADGVATLNVRDCLKPVISLRAWTPMANTTDARTDLPISSAILGDVNGDGQVNGADLGMMLSAWGSGNDACDLNNDGIVNGADLGLLLAQW
ncbi:MAG: C25 family cysteine peptidase [Phycisphaerales bacterium]|nr:C25 family cysteine peptidase [Phycisphaerales bacterium]